MQRPCWLLKIKQYAIIQGDTESVGLFFPCDLHDQKSHIIFIHLSLAKGILAEYDERLAIRRAEEKAILATKSAEDGDTLNTSEMLPEIPEVHWECQLEGRGKLFGIEIDALRKGIKGVEEGTGDGNIEWRDYD